jgi:hypothetical protein
MWALSPNERTFREGAFLCPLSSSSIMITLEVGEVRHVG